MEIKRRKIDSMKISLLIGLISRIAGVFGSMSHNFLHSSPGGGPAWTAPIVHFGNPNTYAQEAANIPARLAREIQQVDRGLRKRSSPAGFFLQDHGSLGMAFLCEELQEYTSAITTIAQPKIREGILEAHRERIIMSCSFKYPPVAHLTDIAMRNIRSRYFLLSDFKHGVDDISTFNMIVTLEDIAYMLDLGIIKSTLGVNIFSLSYSSINFVLEKKGVTHTVLKETVDCAIGVLRSSILSAQQEIQNAIYHTKLKPYMYNPEEFGVKGDGPAKRQFDDRYYYDAQHGNINEHITPTEWSKFMQFMQINTLHQLSCLLDNVFESSQILLNQEAHLQLAKKTGKKILVKIYTAMSLALEANVYRADSGSISEIDNLLVEIADECIAMLDNFYKSVLDEFTMMKEESPKHFPGLKMQALQLKRYMLYQKGAWEKAKASMERIRTWLSDNDKALSRYEEKFNMFSGKDMLDREDALFVQNGRSILESLALFGRRKFHIKKYFLYEALEIYKSTGVIITECCDDDITSGRS
ncbi:uncharacterized protein NEMAJ01_0587 [Nematocida major]|uniref:uncharacterized protein n=1 Tax=Nematocida major TaxID=1912982 RepID=UPI002007A311|nr:uncharacterized protein NEMAJ01_0587 [Nematocida major]KAH9385691.1 hypothetical protein NEMAJ01_0587 [Nematocida major]